MAKLTTVDISNISGNPTSAETNINNNFALVETAIENTLSRDGSTPNSMGAQLDMNSNKIINGKAATNATDIPILSQITSQTFATQVGQAGNFLKTDGTDTSWYDIFADLASTANAKGSSLIGVEDSAGNFTATTVETILTEIADDYLLDTTDIFTGTLDVIGNMGVGLARTEGTLHVLTASAGAVTARTIADDLVVESNVAGGISIITPDGSDGSILFGSPGDNYGAYISNNRTSGQMAFGVDKAGGQLIFSSGENDTALIIDGSQNVDVVGDITALTVNADGDTSAGDNAAMGYTVTEGLVLTGQGSTFDISMKNDLDNAVLTIASGTTVVSLPGTLSVDGTDDATTGSTGSIHTDGGLGVTLDIWCGATIHANGDTSAGDLATIGYTATEGLILTGQGSVNDVTIKNDADVTVLSIATGTATTTLHGNVAIGQSTRSDIAGPALRTLQLEGTTSATTSMALVRNVESAGGCNFIFGKTRGTALGESTIVEDGDSLGVIIWAGADGTNLNTKAASMDCVVDGTPGVDDMPGKLVFSTTSDGASTPSIAVMIDSNQRLTVGNSDALGMLDVDQRSLTGAVPVLYLDQADLSEEFIRFDAEAGTGKPVEVVGAKSLTTTHFLRINVNGTDLYLQVGTIA